MKQTGLQYQEQESSVFSQPFFVAEAQTQGRFVEIEDTIDGFSDIIEGKWMICQNQLFIGIFRRFPRKG